jgi:hypothetical protein
MWTTFMPRNDRSRCDEGHTPAILWLRRFHTEGTEKGRVEEGRGVVCTVRLPSPLIKPDVRISRIRLSDWFHVGPTT